MDSIKYGSMGGLLDMQKSKIYVNSSYTRQRYLSQRSAIILYNHPKKQKKSMELHKANNQDIGVFSMEHNFLEKWRSSNQALNITRPSFNIKKKSENKERKKRQQIVLQYPKQQQKYQKQRRLQRWLMYLNKQIAQTSINKLNKEMDFPSQNIPNRNTSYSQNNHYKTKNGNRQKKYNGTSFDFYDNNFIRGSGTRNKAIKTGKNVCRQLINSIQKMGVKESNHALKSSKNKNNNNDEGTWAMKPWQKSQDTQEDPFYNI